MRLLFIAATLASTSSARFAGIQDVDAYPKYGVTFLNSLPVANETAQSWLEHGLTGGEAEFIEAIPAPRPDQIDGSDNTESGPESTNSISQPIHHMRFGSASYVCLIPPAVHLPHTPEELEPAPEPSKTWELLQPLAGKCLYHKQGWFTYSYCHGQHVRQFRQLQEQVTLTFPPVVKMPEEDPDYPSYTLGRSAQSEDGSVSERENGLELARGTGQRYLHFRWGDGSVCDRTGKRREVEVQFHCSMAMSDTIVFVKETRTCEYTLVIHTPRLCSEPGFRRVLDDLPAQPIRCREVLPAGSQPEVKSIAPPPETQTAAGENAVGEPQPTPNVDPLRGSRHPKQYKPRPLTRLPARKVPEPPKDKPTAGGDAPADPNAALRKVLESLLGIKVQGNDKPGAASEARKSGDNSVQAESEAKTDADTDATDDVLAEALGDFPVYNIHKRKLKNGETVIEFEIDPVSGENEMDDLYEDDLLDDDEYYYDDEDSRASERDSAANEAGGDKRASLMDALRAAGYDVVFDKPKPAKEGRGKKAAGDRQEKDERKQKRQDPKTPRGTGKQRPPPPPPRRARAAGQREEL